MALRSPGLAILAVLTVPACSGEKPPPAGGPPAGGPSYYLAARVERVRSGTTETVAAVVHAAPSSAGPVESYFEVFPAAESCADPVGEEGPSGAIPDLGVLTLTINASSTQLVCSEDSCLLPGDLTRPASFMPSASAVRLQASGGQGIAAFDVSATAPHSLAQKLRINDMSSDISTEGLDPTPVWRSAAVTLKWGAQGAGTEPVRIFLIGDADTEGSESLVVLCSANDDGEFTLPAAQLARFAESDHGGNFGAHVTVFLSREARKEIATDRIARGELFVNVVRSGNVLFTP